MPDEQEQIQEQKQKKKKEAPKLAFELGAVFKPEGAKDEAELDDMDYDMARYRASKGEAGTRHAGDGSPGTPGDYVSIDEAY